MTVSGCTIAKADRQLGQSRESHTQNARSRGRNFTRLPGCRSTATCCRIATFSAATAALEFSIAKTQLYQHNPDGMLALIDDNRPTDAKGLWAYSMALYTAGRTPEFEDVFAELRDNWGDAVPLEIAMVHAWSGDIDTAFQWLERTIELDAVELQLEYRSPFFFNLHGENLREIKLLVDYGGFSPMGAIEAGTGIAARVLGLEKELGTVAEGKVADLVMVEGNPLDEIDVLLNQESICLVMQGGKIVKGDSNNQ